ncbi:MAG: DUF3416 domain-containing protein, partial [Rhodospirillales bacterium]|nr:DUF3416 domain-containing protein [Rhodospirillales bacterium]
MATSPRIYNLFPLLVGSVADWRRHLGRIAAMGFDWVYLNPFQYPGFSGSLYAVKDPSRLHPLFQGDSADSPDALLRGFVADAESHRLRVMMDLVINHTSKDALLVEHHPEWFLRNPDGSVKSPGTVDPDDPTKITEWGDLAEIDYHNPGTRPDLIGEWSRLASHYAELGFAGFRCDAAYQVPGEVWQGIIQAVRRTKPDTVFAAETLGCTPEQVQALGGAGFDLLFNSAKWWDFEAPWLLEQYDLYRRIAPSVAFPESHDTPRLVTKAPAGADPAAFCRQRATFAAFFSAGWMIPIGFEFGFDRQINVVTSRPEDWQEKRFDLSEDIAGLNRMKAGIPALRQEGPQERLNPPGAAVLVLLRHLPDGTPGALLVLNRDPAKPQGVNLDDFSLGPLDEVFPGDAGGHEGPLRLAPLAARIFVPRHQRGRHPSRQEGGDMPVSGQVPRTITRAIVIEDVRPRLDCGRHAVKREVGDMLEVSADILKEGHDKVAAALLWREQGASQWSESPMRPGDNDRWHGEVRLTR